MHAGRVSLRCSCVCFRGNTHAAEFITGSFHGETPFHVGVEDYIEYVIFFYLPWM